MPFRDPRVYITAEDLDREREEIRGYDFTYREPGRLRRLWWRVVIAFSLPPKPPELPDA